MRKLVKKLEELLEKGTPCVLCTIVASSGSTPRGEGAMMIVTESGRAAGTIGGGAVEYEAQKRAEKVLETKASETVPFVLRKNEAEDIGMVCGGSVQVEFTYLDPEKTESLQILSGLKEKVSSLGRVWIFGGGHVSQALVPVLHSVDFECCVVEDRKEFLTREMFPDAAELIFCSFDRILTSVSIQPEDYVCIMTRGHKDDVLVEKQVLSTGAKYIGVIGSRKKTETVNRKLLEMGADEASLKRICTPIGMHIRGAETPAEIAVSIAAEMIEVRAGYGVREKTAGDWK